MKSQESGTDYKLTITGRAGYTKVSTEPELSGDDRLALLTDPRTAHVTALLADSASASTYEIVVEANQDPVAVNQELLKKANRIRACLNRAGKQVLLSLDRDFS